MLACREQATVDKRLVLASIPAFPPIALAVLDMASQDDVTMRQLSDVIRSDAVLSAQVLRLANSPLFGFAARISSLNHALSTLGMARIQGLAMTVATSNYLKKVMRIGELRRCWRHTLASAILCRELARAALLSGELGYMLGLLHDIGRLGLLVTYPNEYAQMLRDADRDPQSLLDKEQRLFGMDHCEAGRRLAQQWNLPDDFASILGRHHDQPSGSILDIQGVVYHGCRLADALGFAVAKPLRAVTFEEIRAALPEEVAARFRVSAQELTEMVEDRIKEHDAGEPAAVVVMSPARERAPAASPALRPSAVPKPAAAAKQPEQKASVLLEDEPDAPNPASAARTAPTPQAVQRPAPAASRPGPAAEASFRTTSPVAWDGGEGPRDDGGTRLRWLRSLALQLALIAVAAVTAAGIISVSLYLSHS